MSTLRDIRERYVSELSRQYERDEILVIFQIVVQDALSISPTKMMLSLDVEHAESVCDQLIHYLSELRRGKPVQYVLGKAPFFGLDLSVGPDTLIPRPETEELVEHILTEKLSNPTARIIDIGTGSGCIALALKSNWPEADITAVDISTEALEVARGNAQRHQLDIRYRCLNILEWEYAFGNDLFDIIVSNPPYVTRSEMQDMNPNVLQFEPHSALFVEDEAPLLFYDYISSFALQHLHRGGALYFEINQYLGPETKDLLEKKGFQDIETLIDINNVPRHMRARLL